MKQLDHRNILPPYGVSITVSKFCLVFPWYENENVMDYLKTPNTNQFYLASLTLTCAHEQLADTDSGLRFTHEIRLVHVTLRPVLYITRIRSVWYAGAKGRSAEWCGLTTKLVLPPGWLSRASVSLSVCGSQG